MPSRPDPYAMTYPELVAHARERLAEPDCPPELQEGLERFLAAHDEDTAFFQLLAAWVSADD